MKNKIVTFESKFGKPEKFNSQFHMVKVYIAYAGKNRNFSIISKETFEKMIPSLYGVPVVGEWKKENEDFGSHGGKIEISEDGVEYIQTTKPYGFIDSSATIQWENVTEEDGTVNEYLTSTAFLWTGRYPEVLKVLENKTGQSMEINVFSGDYSEDDPEYFEILEGEFSGICLLGEDIEPCFEGAKVSQFNLDKDEFKSEFTQMVAELKKSLNFTTEGGESVEKNKDKKEFEDVEETVEEIEEEIVNEEIQNDTEENIDDTADTSEFTDENLEIESTEDNTETPTEEEKFTKVFELSHDDIRSKLYKQLIPFENEDDEWYWINEVYDDYFVYSSDYTSKYFKQNYIKTDVDVALEGERVELFVEYLTANEVEELKKMRKEYQSLLDFKTEKEQEEFEAKQIELRQEKIDHINTEYTNIPNDVKELFISKVDEYETVEDIDSDICVYIVKNKVTFSKARKEQTTVKVNVEENTQNPVASPYGDLF